MSVVGMAFKVIGRHASAGATPPHSGEIDAEFTGTSPRRRSSEDSSLRRCRGLRG